MLRHTGIKYHFTDSSVRMDSTYSITYKCVFCCPRGHFLARGSLIWAPLFTPAATNNSATNTSGSHLVASPWHTLHPRTLLKPGLPPLIHVGEHDRHHARFAAQHQLMQQLVPEQDAAANPVHTLSHHRTIDLDVVRILQHHMRDDAWPEAQQGVVLGALGVHCQRAVDRDALAALGPVGECVAHCAVAVKGQVQDLQRAGGADFFGVVGEV